MKTGDIEIMCDNMKPQLLLVTLFYFADVAVYLRKFLTQQFLFTKLCFIFDDIFGVELKTVVTVHVIRRKIQHFSLQPLMYDNLT